MTQNKQEPPHPEDRSLSEPFAFRTRIHRADTRVDFIPVLDLIVIAMLVSLLFTRFVSLPGVRIDLPVTEMRMQHTQQAVAVLTIGNNGMLFFNGAVFDAGTIERGFKRYIEDSDRGAPVLLVKADFNMEMQQFLRLCELAKGAGFIQVQLAGKKDGKVGQLLPTGIDRPPESLDSFE
ncbi:MAG: ExbD/TolR family protein [Opitutales bacterium]